MKVINQLIDIVENLYAETHDYLDQQDASQLWYNRGYANGVVASLQKAGFEKLLLSRLELDTENLHQDEKFTPWAKAYFHGFEMGEVESNEVLP